MTALERLLRIAVEKQASDLHLVANHLPVLRLRGALVSLEGMSAITAEDTQKALESISTEKQKETFYRELEIDFAYELKGLARFRVNASFQRGTIALAFRMVPTEPPSIDALGLPELCKSLMLKPRGLVLVTGPTGSGKTTTLAAMINYLNERATRKVITIEDPVEYPHISKKCLILQRELGQDTMSFASALKHALRQDPDVILLGEMRDLDTIATAITAAETGHLVLSTLHTRGCAETVDRMVDAFPSSQQHQISQQIALVLEGVLCQELLPRADGKGRVVAVEVMVATTSIRNLIREGKTFQIPNYLQMGNAMGMLTLDQSLTQLIESGTVTLEEALKRAQHPDELAKTFSSSA